MAVSMEEFVRELKAFDGRRAVVQAMRRGLRAAVPPTTGRIRTNAVSILPRLGGLGRWAAESKITATVRYAGRSAGVKLKGSRKSLKNKSDLNRLDAGTVRHPSWGRRGGGQWHTQTVSRGWFTTPAVDAPEWRDAVDREVDKALDEIRRG
jgi:hypothetical protein